MSKAIKLGVVMDAINSIHPEKDTTLALLLCAQQRGWQIYYMEMKDLFIQDGISYGNMRSLAVHDDTQHWFDFINEPATQALHSLDIILMRKDPPFNMEYIYATYILELAEAKGTLVVNKPQSLRDANEKVFSTWFAQCMPKTLISRNAKQLHDFINDYHDVVLKPLHSMGGGSIFKLTQHDPNINVVIETLTKFGTRFIMAQQFIREISEGDKRIILINGEPIPYALARIPQENEIRGNLAAGGKGVGVELSERDYWICQQIAPILKQKGLLFVGIDVIGDYLTEINVTSPTCLKEIQKFSGINIAQIFFDVVESQLNKK